MPTQLIEIHYLCDVCDSRHKTEALALECELSPTPVPQFKLGDELEFLIYYSRQYGRHFNRPRPPMSKGHITEIKYVRIGREHELNYIVRSNDTNYWVCYADPNFYALVDEE